MAYLPDRPASRWGRVLPLHAMHVTLIRQLRPQQMALFWRYRWAAHPGEEPANCGRRELLEETGLTAARLEPLGIIHSSRECSTR